MREPLANRLGPLTSETGNATPAAPNSDVRERLATDPPRRRQPVESRLGRPNEQNPTSSQTSTSESNLPATIPVPAGNSSANLAPAEAFELTSVLLWNSPVPSAWDSTRLTC